MMVRGRRGLSKVLLHAAGIIAIYLAFTFSLFLGLQVEPLYGNAGLVFTATLAAAYVYFGWIRRK